MTSTQAHYEALFASVVERLGALSPQTMTAVIGFTAGGPVSMVRVPGQHAFVTCELSLVPEQIPGAEGERFELLCRLPLSEDETQDLLTGLGALSMEAELGDGHAIDVSGLEVAPLLTIVRLSHFSSAVVDGERYGIYEVLPG
ncbi:MAG: hypothetical protein AB7G12_09570 [Thermoanaerobaculia bacterium]